MATISLFGLCSANAFRAIVMLCVIHAFVKSICVSVTEYLWKFTFEGTLLLVHLEISFVGFEQ